MVQWGWISKLYHYPTYASFALDNGFATYKGAFLGVGFDRCINPAPGSPLRGTRPSRHQTIEAKAHCENDPANPKDRLDQPDQPTLSMGRAAFAFSLICYPHRHQRILRCTFPLRGAMRIYPVPWE
jgi:hypothetical protein